MPLPAGRLLSTDAELRAALAGIRTIAVLGMKGPDRGGPAWTVPRYLHQQGFRVIPVGPACSEAFGIPGKPDLDALGEPVDLLNVFRRSDALMGHLPEILRLRPRLVWLQLGIRSENFASALAEAGIDLVEDRCLFVEHARLF
jgi:predicted CoA-binding protein